jgi:hypothetical protein
VNHGELIIYIIYGVNAPYPLSGSKSTTRGYTIRRVLHYSVVVSRVSLKDGSK